MNTKQKVEYIFNFVRKNGQVVPRGYQTIGGMWTVDTYVHPELPGVKVQLMDEGYTNTVISNEVNCRYTYGSTVVFAKGNEIHLDSLIEKIKTFG